MQSNKEKSNVILNKQGYVSVIRRAKVVNAVWDIQEIFEKTREFEEFLSWFARVVASIVTKAWPVVCNYLFCNISR